MGRASRRVRRVLHDGISRSQTEGVAVSGRWCWLAVSDVCVSSNGRKRLPVFRAARRPYLFLEPQDREVLSEMWSL